MEIDMYHNPYLILKCTFQYIYDTWYDTWYNDTWYNMWYINQEHNKCICLARIWN